MKIGVFGDSFADQTWDQYDWATIWYKELRLQGHTVSVFGEAGSSISYSAKLIEWNGHGYDLIIWCVTTPGRVSYQVNNQWYHISAGTEDRNNINPKKLGITDVEVIKKHMVASDYIKWLFDWEQAKMESSALVRDFQSRYNMMVIPCFEAPMSADFNLYNICEWEAQHWFPGKNMVDIQSKWKDMRPGHLGRDNQLRLGKLIGNNLNPGIFTASIDDFMLPTQSLNEVFEKV